MHISKIHIENFKGYKVFDLQLESNLNILTGDNESRKTSVLEAINLVLSGYIDNTFLTTERVHPYLFNQDTVVEYIQAIENGENIDPPAIRIELFFPDDAVLPEDYEGMNNFLGTKSKGVYYQIALNELHRDAYYKLLEGDRKLISSLPLEYYKVSLVPFSGNEILRQSLPIKSVLVDVVSSSIDVNESMITRVIKNDLSTEEVLQAKQFHRSIKDEYKKQDIHNIISSKIPDSNTTASIDPSAKNSWDSHLSIYYKNIPFSYIGKGRQSIMKTFVALGSNKANEAKIILIEEPENHLSHTNLSFLIREIEKSVGRKQVIITSHSSFVANKLGMQNLRLLSEDAPVSLSDLTKDTEDFFKKLPGYDTLRLLLSKKAILVEGDADELVVQRAYMDTHKNNLPIMDGIEVISVNNTYRRFVSLSAIIKRKTAVIIDADNSGPVKQFYKDEISKRSNGSIGVFFEINDTPVKIEGHNMNTLEPLLLKYNGREILNSVLDENFDDDVKILKYMQSHKTLTALKIFESKTKLKYPKYITDSIAFIDEQIN